MRKVKEILRQKWVLGRSHREVARSLAVSIGVVSGVLRRAALAKLDWPAAEQLLEPDLENRLYGNPDSKRGRPIPDCAALDIERKKPGVTLELLHLEYLEENPNGYGYTQFCEYYRRWVKKRRRSMRQVHRAGEKMFVDYAGKKPTIVDRKTGEEIEVELFVAVLGASNYTYAEATRSQQLPEFIASNTRAVEFFGGVPELVVPDQLRSAVAQPCRYKPGLTQSYAEWAQHYGTVVLPARPAKPRDKAKVEAAVLLAERWILARLRHETFFSLGELNRRIAELLEDLNGRKMRHYGKSRRELFELLDCPALQALPLVRFEFAEWKKAKVNIDYHIEIDRHFYSVPHPLVGEHVEARVTNSTVEIFHRSQRLIAYVRSYRRGHFTTTAEHMPKSHRKHAKWTPSRLINWGSTVGPNTAKLVEAILNDRPHPEQGYRSCLGIMRLGKRFGDARLEAACARGLAVRARSYRHLESILKHGLDKQPLPTAEQAELPLVEHENIRGNEYYR